MLLVLIPALILSLTPSVIAAQTQSTPSSYQTAQMQFLETYGAMPDGMKPSEAEAWSVVQAYPAIPTNAELANLVSDEPSVTTAAPSKQVPNIAKVGPSKVPPGNCSVYNITTIKSPLYDYDIEFRWGRGVVQVFWICQNMNFVCNINTGKISLPNTFGNEGVTIFGDLLWHYVGYNMQDNMPKWIYMTGTDTFLFSQTFGWGYGPVSGQYSFHMYIQDFCNSWKNGGPFATGGYES
jgi:hypothetical protein